MSIKLRLVFVSKCILYIRILQVSLFVCYAFPVYNTIYQLITYIVISFTFTVYIEYLIYVYQTAFNICVQMYTFYTYITIILSIYYASPSLSYCTAIEHVYFYKFYIHCILSIPGICLSSYV